MKFEIIKNGIIKEMKNTQLYIVCVYKELNRKKRDQYIFKKIFIATHTIAPPYIN